MRRKLTLDNATKRKRLEQSSREWRLKMAKTTPKDDRCPFGCGAEDERMHVFTCKKASKYRAELATNVLAIFNEASITNLQAVPLWFSAPAGGAPALQDEQVKILWRKVERFPRALGNMGFIPKALPELLKKHSKWKRGTVILDLIRRAQKQILLSMLKIWREAQKANSRRRGAGSRV